MVYNFVRLLLISQMDRPLEFLLLQQDDCMAIVWFREHSTEVEHCITEVQRLNIVLPKYVSYVTMLRLV